MVMPTNFFFIFCSFKNKRKYIKLKIILKDFSKNSAKKLHFYIWPKSSEMLKLTEFLPSKNKIWLLKLPTLVRSIPQFILKPTGYPACLLVVFLKVFDKIIVNPVTDKFFINFELVSYLLQHLLADGLDFIFLC